MIKKETMGIDLFGFKVQCIATEINGLSLADSKSFLFYHAELNGKKFIVAKYLREPVGAVQMYNQLVRIENKTDLDIVIYLDSITYRRRASYMQKGIPFIAGDKQVYIPFLGMSLTRRCDRDSAISANMKFKISTQLLLLYYLHSEKEELRLSDANDMLGYSRMTLSRAGRELVETKLFDSYREGNSVVLRTSFSKREIFEKLSERYIRPDRFAGYSMIYKIDGSFTFGGADALAQRSMLGLGRIPEYATAAKEIDVQEDYLDIDRAVKIYQWKYNPLLFSDDNFIDPLSIAISLMNDDDERVQLCLKEMLKDFWEKKEC